MAIRKGKIPAEKSDSANYKFLFVGTIILVLLDQLTKAAVRYFLPPSASIPVLGFAQLTHWANTGSVFGLFPGTYNYIALLSLAVVSFVVVLYLLGFLRQRLAVTLLVAGMVGNTIDRISQGFVTDFIYIRPWPAFNLADAFLTIGTLLFAAPHILSLLPRIFRRRTK